MLIGLDKTNFSISEMYNELANKLKSQVGKIDSKNIIIVDNESLISSIKKKNNEEGGRKEGRK